jgi:anti-sigma factor RsiW
MEDAVAGQRILRQQRRRCAEVRLELGVYVLGAIEAADRSVVSAHLAYCADCRDELAELAGLPRLLSQITAAEAERLVGAGDGSGLGPAAE